MDIHATVTNDMQIHLKVLLLYVFIIDMLPKPTDSESVTTVTGRTIGFFI